MGEILEKVQQLEYSNTQLGERVAKLEKEKMDKDCVTVKKAEYGGIGMRMPKLSFSGTSVYNSLLNDLVRATDNALGQLKQDDQEYKKDLSKVLTFDKNITVEFLGVIENRRVKVAAIKKRVMRKVLCMTAIVKCNDYPNFNWAFYGEAIFNPNDKFDVFEGGKICIERMCLGEKFAVKQFIWNGFIADRKRFEKMTEDYQSWMYREKYDVSELKKEYPNDADAKTHIETEIKTKNEK